MNAPVAIKGWCPTTLRPMMSGDGLLVRVRVRDATLVPANAMALADGARRHGNGHIDLTQRANIQIRGVRPESFDALVCALRDCGFVGADTQAGQVVNIATSPLAGLDATMQFDPRPLACEIERGLLADTAFRNLPSKFGFSVDGGGVLPLGDVSADVAISAHHDDANARGTISLAGSAAVSCNLADAPSVVLQLARAYLDLRTDERRMRALVERTGAEAILARAGLAENSLTKPPVGPLKACRPLGLFLCEAQTILGIAAPFGSWTADDLAWIADRMARSQGAALRLTPWRVILLAGLSHEAATDLRARSAHRGLIVDPNDPRLAIAACAGAPSCSSASVETRVLADHFARMLPVTDGVALHVSGCSKGCAHPHRAPLTLVGRQDRYELVMDGTSSDAPVLVGLRRDEAIRAVCRKLGR